MKKELSRQAVHLSGIGFVLLVFYVPLWLVSMYSFMVSAGILAYASYIRMEKSRILRLLERIESPFRKAMLHLERKEPSSPLFAGAFWFFFSLGLSCLLFPMPLAPAAMWMLSVGDAFSTLVGKELGRHRLIGAKTTEGSLAMFLSCMTAVIFLPLHLVAFGSAAAVLAELIPEVRMLKALKSKGVIDDNLLVPVAAGAAMWVAALLLQAL